MKQVLLDHVDIVAEHDVVVRSPSIELKLPSIVVLRDYKRTPQHPRFTRHNLMLRDRFCCGYCGHKFPAHELTYDHVVPRSRGGKTIWENIIIACGPCNVRKAARTPQEAGMQMQWRPWRPTMSDLARRVGPLPEAQLYNGWRDYLDWDGEHVE